MQKFVLSLLIVSSLISCKKQTVELPVSQSTIVPAVAATAVTDPVNYSPSVSNVKTNATQLNYGVLKVAKFTNLLMANVTPEIMSISSIHIYLKANSKYIAK